MILDRSYYEKHGFVKGIWLIIKGLFSLWGRRGRGLLTQEERQSWKRGRPHLKQNEKGQFLCVSCQLCSVLCPAHCITITSLAEGGQEVFHGPPTTFEIDFLRCIFCGYCAEVCPVEALEILPESVSPKSSSQRGKKDFLRDLAQKSQKN